MQLTYYTGNNFGDALNPLIFHHFLPDFFNQDPSEMFLGIGSILGFLKPDPVTRKAIVFSSGFAYDDPPELDGRYDVRCVRGPLTAKALGLDPDLGVADGALLTSFLPVFQKDIPKKYKFCFVPHHTSEGMYDRWDELLEPLGIHYISPAQDPVKVINEIRASEVVLAEAMHASILADTFRVPWIPVKMFLHINHFKWSDWMASMKMGEYKPYPLKRVYNKEWISWILNDKLRLPQTSVINQLGTKVYKGYQKAFMEKALQKQIRSVAESAPLLSQEAVLQQKQEQLMQILEAIGAEYSSPIQK